MDGLSNLDRPILAVLATAMVSIGVAHFVVPEPFIRIVPAYLPAPAALVYVSGAFEIAGGIGVLIPRLRRVASWGLIALFIAVFPANINMAIHGIQLDPQAPMPIWAMWARLPLQALFIATAFRFTRAH